MSEFVRCAKVSDVQPGRCHKVEIEGEPISVFNIDGEIFAIDDTCTHAEASLAEGEIEGHEVICPLHFAAFDLRTGEALTPPADEPVRTHAVRIVDDYIEVAIRTE